MPSRKGSANKNKQFLLKRLQDMYGEDFDPIIRAAENANRMQEIAVGTSNDINNEELDIEERIAAKTREFDQRKDCVAAWERVGQYVTPKLKAVEVTGADGEDLFPTAIKVIHE